MDESIQYEDGDVVWVKLGNCWWPGEVCSETRLPEGILKQVRKRPLVIVQFFDETKYEYVKNFNNICKYNDDRKFEFIQKGLDLLRSNKKYMEKFPLDVCNAERLTDGDVDIVSREQFNSVKKQPFLNIFSEKVTKRNNKRNKKSPGRPLGTGRKALLQKSPLIVSKPKSVVFTTTIPSLPPPVTNTIPDTYKCKMCPFSTSRCNIMIMHMKTHTTKSTTECISPPQLPTLTPVSENQKKFESEKAKYSRPISKYSSPPPQFGSDYSEDSDSTEQPCEVKPIEPPKKRRLPKKPGLKHIILADWSEDDDDDDEERRDTQKQQDARDDSIATDVSPLIENQLNKSFNDSLTVTIDNSPDVRKDQENSPISERTTTVTKYRNIPKKDRRDIVLSEFNSSNIAPNEGLNETFVEATAVDNSETIEKRKQETIVEAEIKLKEINLTEETSVETSEIVEASNSNACVSIENDATPENDSGKELNETADERDNSVLPTTIEKTKTTKKLSCFDFKDDEEDDTDDFLSSLSKLKEKYMSPEKSQSVEEEPQPMIPEQDEIVERRDEQLVADIENLLNATKSPEFEKVETESMQQDVRGLPPKERGKRIFKSRNRSKIATDANTSADTTICGGYQRQASATDSNDDLSPNVESETVKKSPVQPQDCLKSEMSNENSGNSPINEQEIIMEHQDADNIDQKSSLTTNSDFESIENQYQTYEINADEITTGENTSQTLQTSTNAAANIENADQHDEEIVYASIQSADDATVEVISTDQYLAVVANTEPTWTTAGVSNDNANVVISKTEHDLNVLAAAETLISMPTKLCTENRIETVVSGVDYQVEENINQMTLSLHESRCDVSSENVGEIEHETLKEDDTFRNDAVEKEIVVEDAPNNMEEVISMGIAEEVPYMEEPAAADTINETSVENQLIISTDVLESASTSKSKSRMGRKTAAKRQKRTTDRVKSSSKTVINEAPPIDACEQQKIEQSNLIANKNDTIENSQTIPATRYSRRTRNKLNAMLEKQTSMYSMETEHIITVEKPSKFTLDQIITKETSVHSEVALNESQSEAIEPSSTYETNETFDADDNSPISSLVPIKKNVIKDVSDDCSTIKESPTTEDVSYPVSKENTSSSKRKRKRSTKVLLDDIKYSEVHSDDVDINVYDTVETIVYDIAEENQSEINAYECEIETTVPTERRRRPKIEIISNELLGNISHLTSIERIGEKQVDLDFEKLDLAQLQQQEEHRESMTPVEITTEYIPATEELVQVSNELCEEEEEEENDVIENSDEADGTTSRQMLDEKSGEMFVTNYEELQFSEEPNEHYEEESTPENLDASQVEEEELTINEMPDMSYNNRNELVVMDSATDEIEHSENLVDSEDNPLVIDTESMRRYDTSEDVEHFIPFNELQKENLECEQIEPQENTENSSSELQQVFPEENTAACDNIEKTETEEKDHVQTEINAAEQILDEISNLTSSIDIILDSERADDDGSMQVQESERKCEMGKTSDENLSYASNSEPKSSDTSYEEHQQADETTPISFEESIEIIDKPNSEMENIHCSTMLEEQMHAENLSNTTGKKRNSHLKYTPSRSSLLINSIESIDPSDCIEEIVDNSQIVCENNEEEIVVESSIIDENDIHAQSIESEVRMNEQQQTTNDHEANHFMDENFLIPDSNEEIINATEVTIDGTENTSNDNLEMSVQHQEEIGANISAKPLTINFLQFDTEPLVPSSTPKPIKMPKSTRNTYRSQDRNKGDKVKVTIGLESSNKKFLTTAAAKKTSSKRRMSKLKDQSTKTPVATTISAEIQERFKVYSFDDQVDTFDAPKKSKYSHSKENKSERISTKAEIKAQVEAGTKSLVSNTERPKHSRSRQVNLQNVSDVCIPKFPKIDRTKRPTQELESQGASKCVNDVKAGKQKSKDKGLPSYCSISKDASNIHATPASHKYRKQDSHYSFDAEEIVTAMPALSSHNAGKMEFVSTPAYGEIQVSTTSLSAFTSTPAITTSKKKSSRTTSTQSRKAKQQQQQQLQLPMQQQIATQSFYESYPQQQSFEMNAEPKVTDGKGKTSKGRNSRKRSSTNILEESPSLYPASQIGSSEKRSQIISSETIVMAGAPALASSNGSGIHTCASEPLFITSKGNLVSTIPSTYSSGYFDNKQRVPELITSVTTLPPTSLTSPITSPGPSQRLSAAESKSTGKTTKRRAANTSDTSKDNSKSPGKLAEIKRLEQKPTGKVLTAHGFNEIQPISVNVIHGKSLRDNSNVTDMPVLVPIGDPHPPAQRMPSKKSSSHSPKDVTSGPSRSSKQMRNNVGSGVAQQNMLAATTPFESSGAHLVRDHTKQNLQDGLEPLFTQQSAQLQAAVSPQQHHRKPLQHQPAQQRFHPHSPGHMHQSQQYQLLTPNQMVDHHQNQLQMQDQLNNPPSQQIKMYHSQHQQIQTEPQEPHQQAYTKQPHGKRRKADQDHAHLQLQHEHQMHHDQQLQLQLEQLQQEQQMQLEQHMQQQQDQQEIVIQQTDDGENIITDPILVHEAANTYLVDLKNIVNLMGAAEGGIAAVQLANGETIFVTQSIDGSDGQVSLGDQGIQIDGQHLLLTDASALEDGIEVPSQEILVQSLDREVYQDGQLIGNVLQIETSDGIKLVEHPIEYQLINNSKAAATNETNAIMPPIMSALEIPSSKSELVINSKSNETGLIGQNLDESLAVIGVTQSSSGRSSLELPITITNPAIAPKTSHQINIGNLYGSGMSQQSQISPTLSAQDSGHLTYELFSSPNVITASQHNQHTIFSDCSGNYKTTTTRTIPISTTLDSHCLNEIILQSSGGASHRTGGIIQHGNDFIIGGEQVCDQYTVVESQGTSDSNTTYSHPTR